MGQGMQATQGANPLAGVQTNATGMTPEPGGGVPGATSPGAQTGTGMQRPNMSSQSIGGKGVDPALPHDFSSRMQNLGDSLMSEFKTQSGMDPNKPFSMKEFGKGQLKKQLGFDTEGNWEKPEGSSRKRTEGNAPPPLLDSNIIDIPKPRMSLMIRSPQGQQQIGKDLDNEEARLRAALAKKKARGQG
jgi:hypothetical protein